MSTPNAFTPVYPTSAQPVTPSDTTEFEPSHIYVGGAGNVAVKTCNGASVTFIAPPVGSVLPVSVKGVLSTGTTATNLVRVY